MRVTLKSGNYYYYFPQTETTLSVGVVVTPQLVVVGGFASSEADRKLQVFMNIGVAIDEAASVDINALNFKPVFNSLGRYGRLFFPYINVMIADNMAGSVSACSDRYRYWRATGLSIMVDKANIQVPIWAIVLNHLSIFGRNQFDYSFAGKSERIESDSILDISIFKAKHRYALDPIRTPAIFLLKKCRQS